MNWNLTTTPNLGRAALLALSFCLFGCGEEAAAEEEEDHRRWEPADTVVMITMDSVNSRILLGETWDWEVAPNLEEHWEEAALFTHTLSPRGVTGVTLATMLTSRYPMYNKVRDNVSDVRGLNTLLKRFQDAGYRTFGFSANMCFLIDYNVDDRGCTWSGELFNDLTLSERDASLVDNIVGRLEEVEEGERIFVWLHLNEVHKPIEIVEPYFSTFHPEPYEGDFHLEMSPDQVTLGNLDYEEADRRYLEAAYASQVRASDEHVGRVLRTLKDMGRYDDAVIVAGVDHGEELAQHHDYFWHGCSPYDAVLRVVFSFRSPHIPPGRYGEWIGMTDVAPTVVDLASSFRWDGSSDGRSLVDDMLEGEVRPHARYFERGMETAGVIKDGWKFILSGREGFESCYPYNAGGGGAFPGELHELYLLDEDPEEQVELAGEHPDLVGELEQDVCRLVLSGPWLPPSRESDDALVKACEGLLGVSR